MIVSIEAIKYNRVYLVENPAIPIYESIFKLIV